MIRIGAVKASWAALIATLILVGQAAIYYHGSGKEVIPSILPWNQFPSDVKGWRTVSDIPIGQDVLDRLRPDDYLNRNYASSDGKTVLNFFVGYFNSRRNGRAPHSPEWCLPGSGWQSLSSHTIAIPMASEAPTLPANEYLIEKGIDKQLVVYWYHQGTRDVANDLVAQMYALPELLLHGRTDTA
ncbi:MAG: EpsI family protein, partial [Acidobacteriota bacterium]|nr:EpsI family protein [Acidobacteriota bacterium]